MALAEMVDGYGLRALARAACVGHVYFCSHGAGITIGVFQLISAALAKHEPREISKSTRQGTTLMTARANYAKGRRPTKSRTLFHERPYDLGILHLEHRLRPG